MSLKNQLSFASGELDPILNDRVTLERFQNGLATGRNAMIGKTGSILSRNSREYISEVGHAGPVKLYSPPSLKILIELGVDSNDDKFYITFYDFNGAVLGTQKETLAGDNKITTANLNDLQFVNMDESSTNIFGGVDSVLTSVISMVHNESPATYAFFNTSFTPTYHDIITFVLSGAGGTGYPVEYAVTVSKKGEESSEYFLPGQVALRPLATADVNVITVTLSGDVENYNEVRIYRRPKEGSAFGFLGTTSNIYDDAGTTTARFDDIGANADFSNGIPSLVSREGISDEAIISDNPVGTGTVYQGRLILGNFIGNESDAIAASRPTFKNNFYRDFPYDSNSALLFKAGSEGKAKILRMIDSDGLVVFTTKGVFVSVGLLSIANLALDKRGGWIIKEDVPPLAIPGALLFVDKTTNTVRQLVYSQELGSYDSIDQSVFSDHIFREKIISSWAYQEGAIPLLIVTFSDGTFATFTYSFEHKMRAWMRQDSAYPVEQVEGTSETDTTFFLTNKNGTRQIEKSIPRKVRSSVLVENPEADKYVGFMDSIKSQHSLVNDSLVGTDVFTIAPVTPADWEGQLTINCGTSALFPTPGLGDVDVTFRVFDLIDKNSIDLVIVSRADDNNITVQPSELFPEAQATISRLYEIHTLVTGLGHLEGEFVSVKSDGNVVSSPNNDHVDFSNTVLQVTGGQITLPYPSAITLVGRPITADIKTLNISTAEQSPTTIESLTVNKFYTRVFDSVGLYAGNSFPENKTGGVDGNSVEGMEDLESYRKQSGVPFIGNRAKPGTSERLEVTLPGEWENQGQMSLRQVDPLHFEILSIIADVQIERRRD